MKVFIVTCDPFPNGMASTNRIRCYCKSLIKAGVKCEVVVFHRTEVYGSSPRNTEGNGVFEGIPFRYIGGTPLRASNVIVRKLNDLLDRVSLLRYLRRNVKPEDAIFTYYRQNSIERLLLPYAKRRGWRIYQELCEYPYATGQVDSLVETKCEKYMTTIFRQYTGAVCISQPLLDLARKYHPQGEYIKVPILIDEENLDFSTINPKKLDAPYIFHSGALYQQKDGIVDVLNAFADALPQLPQGTKYFFTGKMESSRDCEKISKTINERRLNDSVVFLGYLKMQELMEYTKGASLFIVYKNENIQNKYCFATKLGEYLLSGNPVIITDVGEALCYLENGKNAYVVEHSNRKQLADTIVKALVNTEVSRAIGQAGQSTAKENFCCEVQGKALKTFFEK